MQSVQATNAALEKPLPASPSLSSDQTESPSASIAEQRIHDPSHDLEADSTTQIGDSGDSAATWLNEQAKREVKYLAFAGEDETDYTEASVRLVMAFDGVKESCGALLLNLNFSQKLQAAINTERKLSRKNYATQQEMRVLANFEEKLRGQISQHEYRLLVLGKEEHGRSATSGNDERSEATALRGELEKLRYMLRDNEAEQQILTVSLQMCAQDFIDKQAQANQYIEEALVSALLMAPDDQPYESGEAIEELDIDTEYQKLCEQMKDTGELDADPGTQLHPCNEDFLPIPQSPEKEARANLRDAYEDAKHELLAATIEFDNRESTRTYEQYQNNVSLQESGGAEGDTPESFDLLWVQKNRDLTRKLIEAEEACADAKAAAVHAGVEPYDDQQSSAFGDEDGAYPASCEEALVSSAPVQHVTYWLDTVSADATADFTQGDVDADDWAAAEVEIGDSYSTIALGKDMTRIKRWREFCGWQT